jgi:hypothetical protein
MSLSTLRKINKAAAVEELIREKNVLTKYLAKGYSSTNKAIQHIDSLISQVEKADTIDDSWVLLNYKLSILEESLRINGSAEECRLLESIIYELIPRIDKRLRK